MVDQSYTFSGPTIQSRYEIVDDPSKPRWDDILVASDQESEEEEDKETRDTSKDRRT